MLSQNEKKRIFAEKMLRPALTTGVSLTALALIGRATGRNLYGGFEKIDKDKNKIEF
jgi:hypothetical protein